METPSLFETEADGAIAAALAKPMPVSGRAIVRRIRLLSLNERQAPVQRARVKVCIACGETFQGRTKRAQFCSVECQRSAKNAVRRRTLTSRTCPECSDTFAPTHHRQRYCGSTCREAGRVVRQREARAAGRPKPEQLDPRLGPTQDEGNGANLMPAAPRSDFGVSDGSPDHPAWVTQSPWADSHTPSAHVGPAL